MVLTDLQVCGGSQLGRAAWTLSSSRGIPPTMSQEADPPATSLAADSPATPLAAVRSLLSQGQAGSAEPGLDGGDQFLRDRVERWRI